MTMWHILLVALGGALGALSRYGLSLFAARTLGPGFAWGTLGVNLLGCFMIGIALSLVEGRGALGPSERLFFMTGFLGALTTFSTYALESVQFARSGAMGIAALNLAANNVLGILLVLSGIWLGRRL